MQKQERIPVTFYSVPLAFAAAPRLDAGFSEIGSKRILILPIEFWGGLLIVRTI
jgi:hypothetical protein